MESLQKKKRKHSGHRAFQHQLHACKTGGFLKVSTASALPVPGDVLCTCALMLLYEVHELSSLTQYKLYKLGRVNIPLANIFSALISMLIGSQC